MRVQRAPCLRAMITTKEHDMITDRFRFRTIWVVSAKNSRRGGLRIPRGPFLLLRDEPDVGETIAARLTARPVAWASDAEGAAVTAWSVDLSRHAPGERPGDPPRYSVLRIYSTEPTLRGLGDDSDPHEPADVTEQWLAEILSGTGYTSGGDLWDCASCDLRLIDTSDWDVPTSVRVTRVA